MIFLYLTITSIQRLIQAGEEVEQAEKEVQQAEKEYTQARKEFDNTVKYGCPNPIVSAGGVIC